MKTRGFEVCSGYNDINIPVRKTKNSTGYDIEAAQTTLIPSLWKIIFKNLKLFFNGKNNFEEIKPTLVSTGIKSYFLDDEVLILANRSSNPGKKGLILANSIGVIDKDYYGNPDNDGHIMFAFYNIKDEDIEIKKGDCIGQAIFQKYLIADDDSAEGERTGGFGSTNK